jgi:hypothetical protein
MVASAGQTTNEGAIMNLKRALASAAVCGTVAIGIGAVLPAGASTPSTSSAPSASAAATPRCDDGHWPIVVDGRPTQLAPGATAGLYLWHDSDGWHAFVTHPGHDKVEFRITVHSESPLTATEARDEHDDAVIERNDDHTATLRADNFGYLDGMNFRTDCSPRVVVSGTIDGQALTAAQVFVGHGNHSPDQVPFVVTRKP